MLAGGYFQGQPLYSYVDEMPAFKGDLVSYLYKNLYYPDSISGDFDTHFVFSFIIDTIGKVQNVRLIRGSGGRYAAVMVKMISSMPHWKPGKLNGRRVPVLFQLPLILN